MSRGVTGNTARAVSRTARTARGQLGRLPDPYRFRRPVYKKDARVARQANQVTEQATEAADGLASALVAAAEAGDGGRT
jgi:hypothetical protein